MSIRIYEIIQKYFNNNYSDGAQKKFVSWLKNFVDDKERDDALYNIWNELDIPADETTERSFESLHIKIKEQVTLLSKKSLRLRLLRIAATLMLPIIATGITYWVMKDLKSTNENIVLVECIVPDGEIRTITLPDSTIVKVNSGSILIYPQQFTNNREVYLNGEAYFAVTNDETKPFIVKTTDMDIEVLGTVFNVYAYTDSENSSTVLQEGKVNVRLKSGNKESVILYPAEQITYNRNSGMVEKNIAKIENVIAWTDGNMVISGKPMIDVIKIIERKYAMKVYLNSSTYENERITMKITDGEDITEFMSVLQYLIPRLKYKIDDNKMYIY